MKGLGNLVARILALVEKSKISFAKIQPSDSGFEEKVKETWQKWEKGLNDFKFNEALISIWQLISFCDRYIEKEKPWKLFCKKESSNLKKILSNLLFALKNIAELLNPLLPDTSQKILNQIKKGKKEILFPKINAN